MCYVLGSFILKKKSTRWKNDAAWGPVKVTLEILTVWKELYLFRLQNSRQTLADVKIVR